MNKNNDVLTQAITKILRPLVRMLLRNGIAHEALNEVIKMLYVDVAEKEFNIEGKKQSTSRVSILTGLSRKEVSRARLNTGIELSTMTQQYNRAARVISGWINDPRFQTKAGQPKRLDFDGDEVSFKALVKQYSGDITAVAIADELLRVGAVERLDSGKIKLIERAYVPMVDEAEKYRILGSDVSDLIQTIDHNITRGAAPAFFQRKVSYNAIQQESVPFLKEEINLQAQACLESLNDVLSKHDSDTNPDLKETGDKRIGVGIYYFEQKDEHEK